MLLRIIKMSRIQSARWAFNCRDWSPSEYDVQLLASGLDAEDKEQVGKFVFQKDAKSAIIGRFLTKKFICDATGILWKKVKILRDTEHKKPYFPQELYPSCRVQFNISHSGDFVVLAGEMGDVKVGVDVMKVEKQRTTTVPEFFRLMNKQFAAEEWSVVKSQYTECEQMAMFYRFWCLKESYTKATGTGITVDLQKICFKLKNLRLAVNSVVGDTQVFVEGQKQEGWLFQETMISNNHIASVAIFSPEGCSDFHSKGEHFSVLSFDELISQYDQISDIDIDFSKRFLSKKIKP
ncbi:L-aminoadipate-semialdehyde dehydrogenase-phosphopantetheinyl transferase-like [Macrosteles quadrilineatus]|uniref:L-aminoadipate-semialdehyde dehydrogenase-phosphopantetheinyl transferase-like n=1 Tax=Macrosteles quadrilineatus TaxID=74068 RepID=UPI0023E0F09F|nr:L-aminoadipate-semialdehyde dehydrogenase-phosphopantetheinyl transferase-like [Macrosteles quadrilineatus]